MQYRQMSVWLLCSCLALALAVFLCLGLVICAEPWADFEVQRLSAFYVDVPAVLASYSGGRATADACGRVSRTGIFGRSILCISIRRVGGRACMHRKPCLTAAKLSGSQEPETKDPLSSSCTLQQAGPSTIFRLFTHFRLPRATLARPELLSVPVPAILAGDWPDWTGPELFARLPHPPLRQFYRSAPSHFPLVAQSFRPCPAILGVRLVPKRLRALLHFSWRCISSSSLLFQVVRLVSSPPSSVSLPLFLHPLRLFRLAGCLLDASLLSYSQSPPGEHQLAIDREARCWLTLDGNHPRSASPVFNLRRLPQSFRATHTLRSPWLT